MKKELAANKLLPELINELEEMPPTCWDGGAELKILEEAMNPFGGISGVAADKVVVVTG